MRLDSFTYAMEYLFVLSLLPPSHSALTQLRKRSALLLAAACYVLPLQARPLFKSATIVAQLKQRVAFLWGTPWRVTDDLRQGVLMALSLLLLLFLIAVF